MRQLLLNDKRNRWWIESKIYTKNKINCLNDKNIRQLQNFEHDEIIVEMWGLGYWLPHVQPTRDCIDGEALAD